ncbi:MAG: hypothetical protein JW934_09450 [Anaerolineae bacterium]|nr:hypothetical protein [Anaerolineae bacterium]
MNPDSERDAQNIFETLCPDKNLRSIYIEIIADGIIEANRYNRELWSVNMTDDAVRLTVAHYYVCTIDKNGIWLALDNDFLRKNDQDKVYLPTLAELAQWGWQMDDCDTQEEAYPTYKDRTKHRDFSANGYYSIGKSYQEAWKHIRKLFLSLIYRAIYYGQDMDKRSPEKHCSGFVKYIRNQFAISVPDPLYFP